MLLEFCHLYVAAPVGATTWDVHLHLLEQTLGGASAPPFRSMLPSPLQLPVALRQRRRVQLLSTDQRHVYASPWSLASDLKSADIPFRGSSFAIAPHIRIHC